MECELRCQRRPKAMTPALPRTVAILVFDEVEILDFAGPYEVFSVASELLRPSPFFVFAVGLTTQPALGRGRLMVTPRYSIADCPRPDILVIPGGQGTRPLLRHEALLAWIAGCAEGAELCLSVCTGALLLGAAGLLKDRAATTHHGAFETLAALSPSTELRRDRRFVEATPKIITSGGISAGIDMSLHVVERLLGAQSRAMVEEEMEYGRFAAP
ncbi:MAG TPA: DJ-1/PfpI family protein [Rectinemataceae bacterium]|nr:DJ-1/PfpI family protein [Rectinemataceae bacterium]